MPPKPVGVLLAGGQSRRMGGGDKCLRMLGDATLIGHAIRAAAPQVDQLVINANGDPSRFEAFELPVVPDVVDGFAGPLAGVLTGLSWARAHAPDAAFVATFATDAPFFPADLVARLQAAVDGGANMACAASNGRAHPVFGLWPVRLCDALRDALVDEQVRKVDKWTARYACAEVAFTSGDGTADPFFNINTPEDLAAATTMLAPRP